MWKKIYIYASVLIVSILLSIAIVPLPVLARYLYNSIGPHKEYEVAASNSSSPEAQYNLGVRLYTEDNEQGLALIQSSANLGNQNAQNFIGAELAKAGNNNRAVKYFSRVSTPEATNNYAIHLFQGLGVDEADQSRAVELLKSIPNQDTFLANSLAMGLESPESSPDKKLSAGIWHNMALTAQKDNNTKEAAELFTKAYQAGNLHSGYNLYLLTGNNTLLAELYDKKEPKSAHQISKLINTKIDNIRKAGTAMARNREIRTSEQSLREIGLLMLQHPTLQERLEIEANNAKQRIANARAGLQEYQEYYKSNENALKSAHAGLQQIARTTKDKDTASDILSLLILERDYAKINPETVNKQLNAIQERFEKRTKVGVTLEPYGQAQTFKYSIAKALPYTNNPLWSLYWLRTQLNLTYIMLFATLLAGIYLIVFCRKRKVQKPITQQKKQRTYTPQRQGEISRENKYKVENTEESDQYMQILGLKEPFSWKELQDAFNTKATQYNRAARQKMTPDEQEAAITKYEELCKAKAYFENRRIGTATP